MTGDPRVEAFLAGRKSWRAEMTRLRSIARESPLRETLKWGQPCYVSGAANVVLIHGFKDYCALLFFKGALLDAEGLIRQTENVNSARQMRFTSLAEIDAREASIRDAIAQAIAVEQAGLKVPPRAAATPIAEELRRRLENSPELKAAFEGLTPGRQRAYLLHFSAPKQAKTREARIEKHAVRILAGKGLDDEP